MAAGHFSIQTFGGFSLAGVARPLRSRNASALLAYLSSSTPAKQPREIIADVLWGGTRVRRARHSLSQALYELRAVLPAEALTCTTHSIELDQDYLTVDIRSFGHALQCREFVTVTELYRGAFLDGFPYVSDAFEDWRLEIAGRTHSQAVGAYNCLVSDALDDEDYDRAASLAQAALILSPLDATLIKVRVECLAAAGETARALRELEMARHEVRRETGAIPPELSSNLSKNLVRVASETHTVGGRPIFLRLVGRMPELQRIRACWNAPTENVRLVTISGEPGIGKSRLLEHAVRRCVLDGAHVFMCQCSEVESKLPYGAIVNLLRSGLRTSVTAGLDERSAAVVATIAPELFPDVAPAHGCSQRVLWETIASLFGSTAANEPLVIAIDNLQWSDGISIEVIRYITKRLRGNRVMFAFAFRGEVEIPVYEDDVQDVLKIQLRELDFQMSEELVSVAAEKCALSWSPETTRRLVKQVGGSPFFLIESVRQIANIGSTTWGSIDELDLAARFDRHLDEVLRGVDVASRRLLDAAAVLGRPAPLHFLARVTGLSPFQISTSSRVLVNLGLLTDAGDVAFSHDILLDAQRRRIRKSDASLWHAAIADVLVAHGDSHAGELAYHYECAGRFNLAAKYAQQATDEALTVHAHAEADCQFQRLIRCSKPEARPPIEAQYLKWLAKCGRLRDITGVSPSTRSWLTATADHEAELALSIADFDSMERKGASAAELRAEALRIVQYAAQFAPHLLITVLWQVADTLRVNGELTLMSELAILLQQQACTNRADIAAEVLSVAALLMAVAAGYSSALPIAVAAVEKAATTGDVILIAKTLYARGTICLLAGRVAAAADDYARVAQLADPIGPDGLIERMRSNLSVVLLEQGRLDEAEAQAIRALTDVAFARRGYAYGNLCMIALRRGDVEAAFRYAHALLEWNSAQRHDWLPAHAQALLGLVELTLADVDGAARRADTIKPVLKAGDAIMDASPAYLLLARVEAERGNLDNAQRLLRDAARKTRRRDWISGARLHLERARVFFLQQNLRNAARIVNAVQSVANANAAMSLANEAYEIRRLLEESVLGRAPR